MSFSKPTSVTSSTKKRYTDVMRRLITQLKLRHPDISDAAYANQIVDDLIAKKPAVARATFRQYKAAVRFVFSYIIDTKRDTSPESCAIWNAALERLEHTTSSECLRRSTRTSARKSRTISRDDFELICGHLAARQKLDTAVQLYSAITVLWLSGVRPSELIGLKVDLLEPGSIRLTVPSAKTTNGRGLGAVRTLYLSGLEPQEQERVLTWPHFAMQLVAQTKNPISRLSQYFGRAVRRIFGSRNKYPSLYSFRHQVTGNMKAAGHTASQIAAVLGHASDATSSRHYLRKQGGRVGAQIAADPALVKQVRTCAKSFQTRRYIRAIDRS